MESGPPYTHSAARAAGAAEDLLAQLGLREFDRPERLEKVPAVDLVEATRGLQATLPWPGELPDSLPPGHRRCRTTEASRGGAGGRGRGRGRRACRDQSRRVAFFILGDQRLRAIDGNDGLVAWLGRATPDVPQEEVVAAYGAARRARGESTTPRDLLVAAGSDLVFRWPSLSLAASQVLHGAAAYVYLFTWETPVFGGVLGACHALEIPFVFGSVRRPSIAAFTGGGPIAESLSERMQAAWVSFARSGDPSHEGIGQWPSWDPTDRRTMVFGPETGVVSAPRNEELAVWERAVPLAGAASYSS